MPFILKKAMLIFICIFNGYGLFCAGKLFVQQSPIQQNRQVEQWKNSPLGLCREFIAFFEKMTVFIYYSVCPNH